jgi:hypothetical protein
MMYDINLKKVNGENDDCQIIQKIMKEEEDWLKSIIDSKTN